MKPDFCEACPLKGEGYVFGEGPEDAQVLFLGEALGAEEALRNRPFVGGAGRTLNNLLFKAGVKRSECYVTNVVRCRPPGNRTPAETEILYCTKQHNLRDFVKKFNLVVPLGNVALWALTGKAQITKWRGSVFTTQDGVKILPTMHPAAIMRQQDMFPAVVSDLSKIPTECQFKDYVPPKQEYNLWATGPDRHEGKDFSFDVETNCLAAKQGSLTVLGLSDEEGTANVYHNLDPELFKPLFASRQVKAGHNLAFDVSHLEANGIPVSPPWFDTMIAHHIVLSDVPNDLGFVSSLYTKVPYWKDLMSKDLEWYNATDTDVTFRLYKILSHALKTYDLTKVFKTSMEVLVPLMEMKRVGVKVDLKGQIRWRIALERKVEKLEAELGQLTNEPGLNWKSPKQLADYLYNRLKLPPMFTKFSSSPTTNEEALKELFDMSGHPVLAKLLELRKLNKLASTYFQTPDTVDGRVHSEYLLHGTATGRLASRDPNLQNVPKGPARSIYIPEPGNVFIQADYSQIEMRIAALLAEEKILLEAFEKGEDIHKVVAAEVYGVPYDQVTKDQRDQAKFYVYGLNYGRGAASIARALKRPIREAEKFMERYFSRFPYYKVWRTEIIKEAETNGYLKNVFGRRRYFFGTDWVPKAYNFLPQSIGADILLVSLINVHDELPEGARMVLTVHDSILVECREDQQQVVTQLLHDVMEAPVPQLNNYKVPIKIGVGKNWGECD